MVGIDEVARAAGVSTATVSRALSGRGRVSSATRMRVEQAADRLGYVVQASASSLASGRTRSIGVLLPLLDPWFFSTVLGGIADVLARRGYDITLYVLSQDAEARRAMFGTFLRRQRVDAVIAVSIDLDEAESDALAGLCVPIVRIGGAHRHMTSLAIDDEAVGASATAHLLGLGHRVIAHIGSLPEFDRDFRVPTQRRSGYERALAEAGVGARDELFEASDFTIAGGDAAAVRLLDAPGERPTAIFAASDEMAVGAILAARGRGLRVPEDLSVIGVDGHELGAYFRLTSIDQFPREQGSRAAELVLDLLEPGRATDVPPPHTPLPFELVVRGSTAPPPLVTPRPPIRPT
ncbi:LacI family DNA-binding transcriptional regulator [Microbacterium sp.]|uniref:LacI family DNA-binding transcriptional regulator n=1 Tax=Microbacterium sp. TaxID=51671 RepID=UPI0037C5D8AC